MTYDLTPYHRADDHLPARRGTRRWAPVEETPNVTDIPVPGDPVPCSGLGDEWFPQGRQDVAFLKSQCKRCWMLQDCRQYGLDHPEEFGIWGGLSQSERLRMAAADKRPTVRKPYHLKGMYKPPPRPLPSANELLLMPWPSTSGGRALKGCAKCGRSFAQRDDGTVRAHFCD